MKGFREGRKLPKSDVQRRIEAYERQVEAYKSKSLDELKELFPSLGGSYREACIEVTRQKMMEQVAENIKKAESEQGKTEEEIKEERENENATSDEDIVNSKKDKNA